MRQVIRYFIKTPIAANMLIVALLLLGVVGLRSMKTTFFPEIPSRIISVQAIYPGASPEEVEEGIVNKIEDNLKGITGIDKVTSVSAENSGTITVEAERGYDPELLLKDVQNSVDRINSFPLGMEPLVVFKRENLGFAISFAITGNVDLKTLKTEARRVEDDLRAMDGISKVELTGFPEEEIEIAFREDKLQAYNITFAEAANAVRNANIDITGGTLKGTEEELRIRARNKSYYADGFRDIIVKNNPVDGGVVYLYQIAEIKDQWSDTPNRSFLDGKPSVVITVQNTLEQDMIPITDKVNAYIEQFNERNTSMEARLIRDGSILLRQRIELLSENGVIGFCLVLLSLALFLNWRVALWVALAIPISFGGMFLFASLLGVTINVITLFGMIVVIGILVDDGIVVGENIYQQFEKGDPPEKAALEGTMKVLPAVFSAILTTVIAFSSFYFIDGQLGDFFSQMATVVILTLIFSLVEATFTLPTHISHALSKIGKPNVVIRTFEKLMDGMRDRLYAPALRFSIRNKWLTVVAMLVFLLVTFGAMQGGIIQTTFFPNIERDDISIGLKMPAGTNESITRDVLDRLEAATIRANERISEEYFNNEKQAVQKIQKNIGPSTFEGNLSVTLLDGEQRDPLSLRTVINTIREEMGPFPEAEQLTYGSQSAFGKPVSISLVGSDPDALRQATDAVIAEMSSLAGLSDVVDNNQEGLQEIHLQLTDKARYLGLQVADILNQVRGGFFGAEAQRLQRGQDEVRVWVRYAEQDRRTKSQLEKMRIRTATGASYPLEELATLEMKRGVIAINHLDGKREVRIEADLANDNVSVSDLTANLQSELIPGVLSNYPSVQPRYEGQNREQQRSQQSIQKVMPVILLLMFFVIALTFNSISQTIILLALIPFGFIGVGWGHWVMDAPISLFSFLGIIALLGIMVNDGLVFITTYNDNLKEGQDQESSLYAAGISRFRAIFLTSTTTILGLAPLMLEKSLQAQFLIPMAISVAYGLLAATVIILLLLPAFLMVSNRIKVFSLYAWNGVRPANKDVEPALEDRIKAPLLYAIGGILTIGGFVLIVSLALRLASMVLS